MNGNMCSKKEDNKLILDMTCGSRTMWFDKNEPHTVYCDKRKETLYNVWRYDKSERKLIVNPDIQCDFTDLPFNDNSFTLVLFDPPHLIQAKETAWLVKKYGKLDDSWPAMLHDGFAEGMRVLAPYGTLVFKWSEHDIPADKVWKAIGRKPLFGTHSGKKMQTFFGVFMKFEDVGWETK
ncbi:SAM-dependent methyltransferase [Anaerolactibacter massiliensis]|uniref:SAM-dependent methyltransferase n=1 Tax=Anaerolactibacter massiliensis TaxID=2044573 RepID=UPI001EFC61BA|nr:SAM-dependent methyltransferase [Anaerolactibacter massiliensis]